MLQGKRMQIDHILLSKGLHVSRAWVDHSDSISETFDHFPILAELTADPDTFQTRPSPDDSHSPAATWSAVLATLLGMLAASELFLAWML